MGYQPYSLTTAQEFIARGRRRYAALQQRRDLERVLVATGTVDGWATAVGLNPDATTAVLREKFNVAPETINKLLPAITLQHAAIVPDSLDVDITATAGGDDATDRALIARHQADYLWYKGDGEDTISRCAWDYLTVGEAVMKVAYEHVESTQSLNDDQQAAAFREALAGALEVATDHGAAISDLVSHDDIHATVDTTRTLVERDGVVFAYVDPNDFLVDEHATSLRDARWACQRLELPMDEVAAREDFTNLDTLVPDGPAGDASATPRNRSNYGNAASLVDGNDDPMLTCVLWEFYDLRTRTLMVFQEGATKPLYSGGFPYEHRGVPFVHEVLYREKPSDFHGFGEVRNIAPLQLAYLELFGVQLENARQAAAHKYFYNKAGFEMTEEVRDALASDVPGEVIGIDGAEGVAVNQLITGWQPNALGQDVYQMGTTVSDAIGATLGQNDFEQGGVGLSHMSGTAASVVAGVSSTRGALKVAAVNRMVASALRIGLALFRENMGAVQMLRVNGQRGSVEIAVTPEMLDGEFDIKVKGASASNNAATRKQDAIDIMNVIAPALASNGYDTEPVMRRALSLMDLDPDTYLKKVPLQPEQPQPRIQEQVDFRDLSPAAKAAAEAQLGLAAPAGASAAPSAGAVPPVQPEPDLGPQSTVGGLAQDAQLGGGVAL